MTRDNGNSQQVGRQSLDWFRQSAQREEAAGMAASSNNNRSHSDSSYLAPVPIAYDSHDTASQGSAWASPPHLISSSSENPREGEEIELDISRNELRVNPEPRQRINLPRLSVNTGNSPIQSGSGTLDSSSTHELRSPLGNLGSPGKASLDQALSPRTRDRRYSLRRSLFARNMGSQNQDTILPKQLPVAGPSTNVHQQIPFSAKGVSGKKPETKVTVVPTTDSMDDLKLPSHTAMLRRTSHRRSYSDILGKPTVAISNLKKEIRDMYQKVYNRINRLTEILPSVDGRQIEIDARRPFPLVDGRTGRPYINNAIRSNKYNPWTFLPRQLVAQFSKLANFYFLCISILQLIPGLSTTGTYTTILPLLFFVGLSIAKEGYEDIRRHRLDKVENSSIATVLRSNQTMLPMTSDYRENLAADGIASPWYATKWQDIQVGDIVRLQRDEPIPADLVVIHIQGSNSIAYVETMALDGETNLRTKNALPLFKTHCASIKDIVQCKGKVIVEDPNLDLYSFNGKLTLNDETMPLTNNQILYRGSVLRNTLEVIGIVIYSGEESKIRMNATKNPRIKAPALQAAVNKVVVLIAIFVLALAVWNTAAYQIWKRTERKSWYLIDASVPFFTILVSFIILFNTYVLVRHFIKTH